MEKSKKIAVCAIILSVVSTLAVAAMIAMWICGVREMCVVELDSFVGIIVALLAIIVTFAIGWQILNAIDVRNNIKDIESKIKDLNEFSSVIKKQQEELDLLSKSVEHSVNLIWAEQAFDGRVYINAFYYSMKSLQLSIQTNQCKNVELLLDIMSSSVEKMQNDEIFGINEYNVIKTADTVIRQQNCFELIQGRYEQIYSIFKTKVKFDDSQK